MSFMHTDSARVETTHNDAVFTPSSPWAQYHGKNRTGLLFVAMSVLFGCWFALITPPLWGFDEATHFARAYSIDHGHVAPVEIPHPTSVNFGGQVPSTFVDLFDYSLQAWTHAPNFPARSNADPGGFAEHASRSLRAPLVDFSFANTSAYSPISYVPAVFGLRAVEMVDGSVGLAITAMRICNVAAYSAIVWLALWALRHHRFKWAVFVVALLPMTVFESAMITADTVTNALAILFSALFVKSAFLRIRLSGPQTSLLFTSVLLLPLAKPTYVLLILLLPLVPTAQLTARRGMSAVVTAAGLAGCALWTTTSAQTSEAIRLMRPAELVDTSLQVRYLITHIPDAPRIIVNTLASQENRIVKEVFGTFGNTWVQAPSIAAIACMIAGALSFGLAELLWSTLLQSAIVATTVLASIAAIFATLYVEYTPVGHPYVEGVQGRYFIPLFVIAIALLARQVPFRLNLESPRNIRRIELTVTGLMFFALAGSTLKYQFVL